MPAGSGIKDGSVPIATVDDMNQNMTPRPSGKRRRRSDVEFTVRDHRVDRVEQPTMFGICQGNVTDRFD